MKIAVKRLPHSHGLPLPERATTRAAGADLRAAVQEPLVLQPGQRRAVPTGFVFEIPDGFEGQVRPRSGLALKHGVTCLNSPGTIDSDYRGEVRVILANLGGEPFVVERGMRVAQLVISAVTRWDPEEHVDLSDTSRGEGGFGHTGTF
ncbi:MAG: dUTP diphosphatase [Acidobacteriota bacterium]